MIFTVNPKKVELLAIQGDKIVVLAKRTKKVGEFTEEEVAEMNRTETRGKWCF